MLRLKTATRRWAAQESRTWCDEICGQLVGQGARQIERARRKAGGIAVTPKVSKYIPRQESTRQSDGQDQWLLARFPVLMYHNVKEVTLH